MFGIRSGLKFPGLNRYETQLFHEPPDSTITAFDMLSSKTFLNSSISARSSLLGSHLQLYARIENDSANHKMRSG